MKYFSMFSGIGGFELGIQTAVHDLFQSKECEHEAKNSSSEPIRMDAKSEARLGCVGFSEINKYAIQVYQQHFKEHKNYGNAAEINPEELEDFDLLVGGFPCQAFSIAGKRLGFEDTRGTLFFEIVRILRVKKPRMFLLENVKGLLSHDHGRTFKTIIAALDELGYGVEWQVLNSKDFGVAQNRERVFIIGYLGGIGERQVFPLGNCDEETCETRDERIVCGTISTKNQSGQCQFDGSTTLVIKRLAHNDVFRRYNQTYDPAGLVESLDTSGGGGHQPCIPVIKKDGIFRETEDTALCLDKSYHKGFDNHGQRTGIYCGARIRRLTPVECERLQGFPDNWTAELSDSQRYKCLGNAVTVPVITAIMRRVLMVMGSDHNSSHLTDRQRKEKTMIENTLERIATALERLVGLQIPTPAAESSVSFVLPPQAPEETAVQPEKPKTRKAKVTEVPPAPQPVEAPVTTEAIAAELRMFVTKYGAEKAKALLQRFAASRVSEIKPDDFQPVLSAIRAALQGKA